VCEASKEGTLRGTDQPAACLANPKRSFVPPKRFGTGIGMGPKKEETPEERRRRLESEKRVRERKEAGLTPDIRDVSPEESRILKGDGETFKARPKKASKHRSDTPRARV